MKKKDASSALRLTTPIGAFALDPYGDGWLGRIRISPRERVEIALRDAPSSELLGELERFGAVCAHLRKHGDRVKRAVADVIVRRHGRAWSLTSSAALARSFRFRSVSASGPKKVTVFFDRLALLRGHSVAFHLSTAGAVSNASIEG